MFRRLSHIVLVLLLLSACGRQKGYSPVLLNSDSLCNVRPDSALVLLQQLSLLTRGLSPCAQDRASQRGYSKNDVVEIMKKGERSIGRSKKGELQYRYVLNRNTVIQNVKDKKIITIFSDMPATSIHVKGYKIPWR